jgi:hypothetical protein
MKWFRKKQNNQEFKPVEVRLPESGTNTIAQSGRLDPYSETWAFIRGYCEATLKETQDRNNSPVLDEVRTAMLRGKIAMLKEIMDLPKPKPEIKPTEDQEELF